MPSAGGLRKEIEERCMCQSLATFPVVAMEGTVDAVIVVVVVVVAVAVLIVVEVVVVVDSR